MLALGSQHMILSGLRSLHALEASLSSTVPYVLPENTGALRGQTLGELDSPHTPADTGDGAGSPGQPSPAVA